MNYIEITKAELVVGGNVVRQGDHFTQGYIPRDYKGDKVSLTGKTITAAIYSKKGVHYEGPATFDATTGVLSVTVRENIGSGTMWVEFTATDTANSTYKQKFPANEFDTKMMVVRGIEDLDFFGASPTTVNKLRGEQLALQQAYEVEVDGKIETFIVESDELKAEFNAAMGALTQDSEVVAARVGYNSLGEKLDDFNTQLAETGDKVFEVKTNMNKEVLPKSKRRVPMMTFIDDDGMKEVLTKWEPILQEKSVPLTVAVVTKWVENGASTVMPWNEIHRLKETYGVEFVNHTHEHLHAQDITDAQIHAEYSVSSNILAREGLTHDIVVQPFGENTTAARRISRDYFRANVATVEGVNFPPLDQYRLRRVTLAEGTNNTWADYKTRIDEAIANNGWIIFKSHSQYPSFDATQIQLIKDIIDYARSNGVELVNVAKGLDRVGNIIDIGDYTLRDDASLPEYTVMDYQGVIHSKTNSKDYYTRRFNSASASTSLEEFPRKSTTMDTIVGSNATGFPENRAGTLVTFKTESAGNSFQMYYLFDSHNVYRRRWNATNNAWLDFVKIGQEIKETFLNIVVNGATIPAQSSADIVLTNTAAKLLDYIQGAPRAAMTAGILYNVFIRADNEIVVRYFNMTQASIAVPTLRFNMRIVKL